MLKIAFLFLSIANVYHEKHWKAFFNGNEKYCSIYLHAKKSHAVTSQFFKQYLIPKTVPTAWEYTMRAQIELLKQALKDPDNAKFVFLSETTIPLKDFRHVYKKLTRSSKSYFVTRRSPYVTPFMQSGPYAGRLVRGIPSLYQQKHTQWVVLNRKHAQILVDSTFFLNHPIYCDNEHFPGTILAFKGLLKEVIQKDTTYVHRIGGSAHPVAFNDLSKFNEFQLTVGAIKQGFLFGRKYNAGCNLKPIARLLPYLRRKRASTRSETLT